MLDKSSFFCRSLFMGTLISLLISPLALADPPANPKEQGVPFQLTLIRTSLDELSQQMTDMEAALFAEMAAMEGRLDSTMGDIQGSIDVGNGKLDVLQTSADGIQASVDALQITADEIYGVVTEVNIDLTTTLCFDAGANFEAMVGFHDEVGIGWPNVLSAKAIIQGEGAIAGGVAVASQICIEVPLYSVASNVSMFNNTTEFDDLIAAIAMPSQEIVPMLANVYTLLMPTPDQAFEAIGNVTEASTGYNVYTGSIGAPNPAAFLRPDELLYPILPHAVLDFISAVPDAVEEALLDPCGALSGTPIGAVLEGRDDVEFLCTAHANFIGPLVPLIEGVFEVVDLILDVVDPLGLVHDL